MLSLGAISLSSTIYMVVFNSMHQTNLICVADISNRQLADQTTVLLWQMLNGWVIFIRLGHSDSLSEVA